MSESQPQEVVIKVVVDPQVAKALDKPRQVPGAETTEFKVSMLAIVSGVCLIAVGLWQHDNELTYSGRDLIQWAVAGYAISRGLSKITIPNNQPPVK